MINRPFFDNFRVENLKKGMKNLLLLLLIIVCGCNSSNVDELQIEKDISGLLNFFEPVENPTYKVNLSIDSLNIVVNQINYSIDQLNELKNKLTEINGGMDENGGLINPHERQYVNSYLFQNSQGQTAAIKTFDKIINEYLSLMKAYEIEMRLVRTFNILIENKDTVPVLFMNFTNQEARILLIYIRTQMLLDRSTLLKTC